MRQNALSIAMTAALLAACNSQQGTNTAQPSANADDGVAVAGAEDLKAKVATLGLYPGSNPAGPPDRFVTPDPIDRVVQWYRDDSARRAEMMFVSTERRDDGHLVIGTAGEEGRSFALKLSPRAGGGTEIQVLPYDPKTGLRP